MNGFGMKSILIYLVVFIAVLNSSGKILAQANNGLAFLRMSMGSRALAMGDAYTALSQDVNGIYYNPGGLGFSQNRELMLSHSKWIEDISIENIAIMYPFNQRLTVAAGVSFLHLPELTRYEMDPLTGGPIESGTFTVYDLVFTTSIGFRLNDYFALGTNLKVFQEGLESVNGRGVAFDIGFLIRQPESGFRLGGAVQHLGPPVQYLAHEEHLPLTYRAGVAYALPNNHATLSVDVIKPSDREFYFTPGIELAFQNDLFIRGGYQLNEREGSGFTAGFGLHFLQDHQINYVYVPYGDLGDTHRAELVFNLGSPRPAKPAEPAATRLSSADEQARRIVNQAPAAEAPPTEDKTALPIEPLAPVTASDNLSTPTGLSLMQLEQNKTMIRWNPVRGEGIKYNVYAKLVDGNTWFKVTPNPIKKTSQVFSQKKTKVKLLFAVTAVKGDEESHFSEPIYFETP